MPAFSHLIPTSAVPASLVVAAFDADIVSITGWSRVENLITVGTNTWSVYKSAAANNAQGADWFFAIGYPTAAQTSLLMTCFELWNTSTKQASNFIPNSTQTPVAVTFANPQAAASLPSTGTTIAYMQTVTLSVTGLSVEIDVEPNRLAWGGVSGANQLGYYFGLYEPQLTVAEDPFPLTMLNLGGGGSAGGNGTATAATTLAGGATREPKQAASASSNFSAGSGSNVPWTPLSSTAVVEAYTQRYRVSRVPLFGRSSSNAFRGLLRDMLMSDAFNTANLDEVTFTLNAVNYVGFRVGSSSTAFYALKT